jgi:hypothetical protein
MARTIHVVVGPVATDFSMRLVVISESATRHSYRSAVSGATPMARRAGM